MYDFFSDIKTWSDEKINEKLAELNRKAMLASYSYNNSTIYEDIQRYIQALEEEKLERFMIKQQEMWEKQFSSTIDTENGFGLKNSEKEKKSGNKGVKKKLPKFRFDKKMFGEE